jgi:hypothetical protein
VVAPRTLDLLRYADSDSNADRSINSMGGEMSNSGLSNSNGGGIGFAGLLTIAFIVLKLTHYIDWSWWWVWSPVLISVAVFFLVVIPIAIVAAIKS